jgi:hypothetical protein
MININLTPYADELVLRVDNLPRKIQAAIREKFRYIFTEVEQELFSKTPGKFLDRQYIESGITEIGGTIIGYIEATDKPGVYSIIPTKAKVLRFVTKSGELIRTRRVYNHPFLKASPLVARLMEESKPWIVDQLEDAVIEGLK